MAGAMLLYDEINSKGFEGDLVLNGFAEFIRNILVCKDARAVKLLDVVEGMQDKYVITAANVNAGYLVSALNIINEAEINFKMARNKRLHVELVIIKLNFLQQAIELSMHEGTLVKKKRIDGPIAVKPKPVNSIQIKQLVANAVHEPKLYIQQQKPITVNKQPSIPIQQLEHANTQALISNQQQVIVPQAIINYHLSSPLNTNNVTDNTKRSVLDVLREKYGDRYTIQAVKDPIPLSLDTLQLHWNQYAYKLKEENKHSQVNAFNTATIEIENEALFNVTVDSTLQQKFIEQEKTMLLDYLQRHYHNTQISFGFKVVETMQKAIPLHLQLNSKQRYERIAEQYPLVKELRDRLKLEIEF